MPEQPTRLAEEIRKSLDLQGKLIEEQGKMISLLKEQIGLYRAFLRDITEVAPNLQEPIEQFLGKEK